MPTYDYVCRACEHEFELFQSMTESPKRKCPECGKLRLERLIGTGAGVIFKGSGFYQTDYRSDSYSKAAEADRKAQSGDSSGDKAATKDKSAKGDKESTATKSESKSTDTSTKKSSAKKKSD